MTDRLPLKILRQLKTGVRWRWVENYESTYAVSDHGDVASVPRFGNPKLRLLKPFIHNGYPLLKLFSKGKGRNFKVHRLVAASFMENPNGYPFVNHVDGDRGNPSVTNLEWCSPSMNLKHAYSLGTRSCKGERNPRFGKPMTQETKMKISLKMRGKKYQTRTAD